MICPVAPWAGCSAYCTYCLPFNIEVLLLSFLQHCVTTKNNYSTSTNNKQLYNIAFPCTTRQFHYTTMRALRPDRTESALKSMAGS